MGPHVEYSMHNKSSKATATVNKKNSREGTANRWLTAWLDWIFVSCHCLIHLSTNAQAAGLLVSSFNDNTETIIGFNYSYSA